MINFIDKARKILDDEGLDFLLINTTNEFLVEYNDLNRNSVYSVTNFSGSTGEVLLGRDRIYLFVDSRYHEQADLETDSSLITVVKLKITDKIIDKFKMFLNEDALLGVITSKISQSKLETLKEHFNVKTIISDNLEHSKKSISSECEDIPIELCGISREDKIKTITSGFAPDEVGFTANIEEISYIFNLRNFSKNNVCAIEGKGLFSLDFNILFTDFVIPSELGINVKPLNEFEKFVKSLNNKIFIANKDITNAYDWELLHPKALTINKRQMLKSVKNNEEIKHYKNAFAQTDKVLLAVRNYINESENLSEFDICEKLKEEFYKNGAKSLSFTPIVAKDKNSALAHYSKSSKTEIIKDGSLVLIDCGAFYEGGLATDITRVFVKGEPNDLQKEVYTKVLKAFLNAYHSDAKSGYEIDKVARDLLRKIAPECFNFSHGLGHGIGVSVHEYPPRLSIHENAKIPIFENTCFTIEPGLYNPKYFGVRLENSCYIQNNKIKSFVKMPYEKKLIDYSLLTKEEQSWLNEFGVI